MKERLCESCDEPIPAGRLRIMPSAKACVPCIQGGFVPDVFTYKSKLETDSSGNFHVEVVQNEHEWACHTRDKEEERKK